MIGLIERIKKNPMDPMLHWELGSYYEKSNQWVPAIAEYRTSITFGNSTPEAFLLLARAYFSYGFVQLGSDICRQLIEGNFNSDLSSYAKELIRASEHYKQADLKDMTHNNYYRLETLRRHIQNDSSHIHCSVLDVGGGAGDLCLFLPDSYYALVEPEINGISAPLPFKNQSFDYVVSCHVLEHIPIESRDSFLDSLCGIATEKVILINPFNYSNSTESLSLVYELTGAQWAKEHLECTMPELEDVIKYAESRNYPYKVIPNGSKALSLSHVWIDHFARMTSKQEDLRKINQYFNNLEIEYLVNEYSPVAYLIEFDLRK